MARLHAMCQPRRSKGAKVALSTNRAAAMVTMLGPAGVSKAKAPAKPPSAASPPMAMA